ncbi:hypothetical protein N7510_007497 [Penicillium lagena]|uniref:uncharacterized protein n=1 Tax=Penicillium lagena TaxID=94218 RepID=UPI002540C015|nr:uncharacterized protein N7510_007497 [Penicillium lagena]KAJ5610778.1 hypothetical protein N7510_007497 [Penicillium lagena]
MHSSIPTATHEGGEPPINWDTEVKDLESLRSRSSRSRSPSPDDQRAQLCHFVSHPWGVIDYYLYLTAIERGRDGETRLNETRLLAADGFQYLSFDDLSDAEDTFARAPAGTNPTIFFVSLPVSCYENDSSRRQLLLGFDLRRHHLLGYLFENAPDTTDLWTVWGQGTRVIDLHVLRFIDMLEYAAEQRPQIFRSGLLRHFRETQRGFPAGLDLVVAIQFAQFLNDFADLLWHESADQFRAEYKPLEDELRRLLQRASCEAWFGSRKGWTARQYRRHKIQEFVASELFFGDEMSTVDPASHSSAAATAGTAVVTACGRSPLRMSITLIVVVVMMMMMMMLVLGFELPRVPDWQWVSCMAAGGQRACRSWDYGLVREP